MQVSLRPTYQRQHYCRSELARDLSRDLSRPTAIQGETQQEVGQRVESRSTHKGDRGHEQEQAHGIGLGVA